MSWGRLGGKSATAIPIPTPIGLDILNIMIEPVNFILERLDWAMFNPRLKAMTAL